MVATSHVIIGGAVGLAVASVTGDPWLAVVAGVASHFIADIIPHLDHPPVPKDAAGELIWGQSLWIFAIVDSLIAWSLVFLFLYSYIQPEREIFFLLGAIGGYLPDFIDNVPFWKDRIRPLPGFKQFHSFHEGIHAVWNRRFPMPRFSVLGVVTQIVAVSLSLYFIILY